MLMEPLTRFYREFGFDHSEIKKVVAGEKYLAVMLRNGQIGVCARLNTSFDMDLEKVFSLDLSKAAHRVFYNAYLNARFNYANTFSDTCDIFDEIDFSQCRQIVMVGYFKPLAKKFIEAGIELSIFDKVLNDPGLTPYHEMNSYLSKAQHIILTSTSIFNQTFMDVISHTASRANVYLLGPSTLLHSLMLSYRNVKKIYGAIFDLHDQQILDLIAQSHGARTFLPHARKVYL